MYVYICMLYLSVGKNDLIVECELKPDTITLLKKVYNLRVYEK